MTAIGDGFNGHRLAVFGDIAVDGLRRGGGARKAYPVDADVTAI